MTLVVRWSAPALSNEPTDGGLYTATAEIYTPAVLSAQPARGSSRQHVTLSGGNFFAGETVTLTWDGGQVLGHATTSATGSFTARVTIPKAAPGTHTLTARGQPQRGDGGCGLHRDRLTG